MKGKIKKHPVLISGNIANNSNTALYDKKALLKKAPVRSLF